MVFTVQPNTFFTTEERYVYAVLNTNATTFYNWNSYITNVGKIYRT